MKALIIGGTSAIGEGIARCLAAMKYRVDFTYHSNTEKAKSLGEALGDDHHSVRVDLSDVSEVSKFVASLNAASAPDVLINVAGITHDALSVGNIGADLARVAQINFLAPASICARVVELMMPRRCGSIINVTSIASKMPRVGNAAYGSTKAALERFTATLAIEVARYKVRTLCIAPGFVDTPMFHAFAGDRRKDIIKNLPLREILAVDDVVNSVAAFVGGKIKTTGTTLYLTNGQSVL